MKKQVIEELNLTPRTDSQLHDALDRFEMKWQQKIERSREY